MIRNDTLWKGFAIDPLGDPYIIGFFNSHFLLLSIALPVVDPMLSNLGQQRKFSCF